MPGALRAVAAQRVEKALRPVHEGFHALRDLAADDPGRIGRRAGAAHLDDMLVLNADGQAAGVGAIEGADACALVEGHGHTPGVPVCGVRAELSRAAGLPPRSNSRSLPIPLGRGDHIGALIEMKPFRFGVNLAHARSRAEWQETARKVEALGYDTLTVPDHLTDLVSPMPALVSAAEATTRLRVGTNVLNNDLRHPVLVAREAAAVDLLTDGRLQLGLGAGSIKSEYDQAGLRFEPGGTRVERLAEAVRILKGLFTGQPITFVGQHYHVTRHQ